MGLCLLLNSLRVSAAILPNTTANGVAYLTYDRLAWATVAPVADYYDIHGVDLGTSAPSADTAGHRWMFPDLFEGTGWVGADYPRDHLTPLPDSSLVQPAGGFALPVNTYGFNSFATDHAITSYNSTTNSKGFIGLGGSFRSTSDFNEPGASVWWEHLALAQDPADQIWKLYATSGPGKGSLFELRNASAETVGGNLHLSADYVFGNTDWLRFFQDYNGHLDTNRILGHIELIPEGFATLSSGRATINFNQTAWGKLASGFGPAPVLTLSGFFDQSQANALTQDHLLHDAQAAPSYTDEIYAINGASVTNLTGRYTQPTTFLFQRGNPKNHTGRIGLGGIARFAVFGGAGGNLLYGDYTLQYDTNRLAFGGTGWYLLGNIPPAAAAFDLLNVVIVEKPDSLTLSGDLAVSAEVANFVYTTPGDTLANVGTFSLTSTPFPSAVPAISSVTVAGGNLVVRGSGGLPGTSYSILSSTNLSAPASSWVEKATGIFNATGTSSNAIPIQAGEPVRYFRQHLQ